MDLFTGVYTGKISISKATNSHMTRLNTVNSDMTAEETLEESGLLVP